jgi:hypothetical protein
MCKDTCVKYACGCSGRRLGIELCTHELIMIDWRKAGKSTSSARYKYNEAKCKEDKEPGYVVKERKCGKCTKKDKEKEKAKAKK